MFFSWYHSLKLLLPEYRGSLCFSQISRITEDLYQEFVGKDSSHAAHRTGTRASSEEKAPVTLWLTDSNRVFTMTVQTPRILCAYYGKTIEEVVGGLIRRDGILRDILLYGQDMRSQQGGAGQLYDGPGGSGGASLAIPEHLTISVPYIPVDSRVTHKVLKDPTVEDIVDAVDDFQPTAVIIHSGLVTNKRADLGSEVLAPIPSHILDQSENLVEGLLGSGIDVVYLDAKGCGSLAQDIKTKVGSAVITWMSDEPVLVFNAYNFLFSFFGAFDIANISPECAFALASELSCAFCLSSDLGAGPELPPSLPHLLSDKIPSLPGTGPQAQFINSKGVRIDAHEEVPGFSDLRLCAPHAEVRLLVAALPTSIMISARLGSLCQGIRGIIAAEVMSAVLVNKVQTAPEVIPAPYLPEGSQAYRCTMKSASGITFDVVCGGPSSVFTNRGIDRLLEYALKQALVADAHSIQLKLPPPGAPMPPYHSTRLVAAGAPVVEVLASTSTWVVYMLKRLCEMPLSRVLVIAGVGAASTTVNTAFSKKDALRQTSTIANGILSKIRPSTGFVTAEMLVGALPEVNPTMVLDRAIPTPAAIPSVAGPQTSSKAISEEQTQED